MMKRLLALLALALFLALSARADTLFLPVLRGGYVVRVTGQARWEPDFGPVAHRTFTLLEIVSDDPFVIFRHNSKSPQARTDAQGYFTFRGVEDGRYVLGIEHPPFGWTPLWRPDEWTLYLVEIEGESVEMGIVKVGIVHLWGE